MFSIEQLFRVVSIEHVWMFFTDRCNLNCEYCFFKHRSNKTTLSFNRIKVLIDTLPPEKYYNFVISGGEPLMEWDTVSKIISYVKSKFSKCPIILQTNGILLNKGMAACLRANDVCVEHGIDGRFAANFRHRKGVSEKRFDDILKSIELVLQMGVSVNPTMAIHPDETEDMCENFKFLSSLGLYSMDVHPTLLEKWEKRHIHIFEKEYLKIIALDMKQGGRLICKDYNIPKGFRLDLVVMPDGNILPNWVYLTQPPEIKQKYFFLKIGETAVKADKKKLSFLLKLYDEFYKRPGVTYRDFSNFNVELLLKDAPDKTAERYFENYKRICDITRKIDQKVIPKEIRRRK